MKLVQGKNYNLRIKGRVCNAKLNKICTYNASGMPNDYLFTALPGEIPILTEEKGYFPIPQFMLDMMEITEIGD
jgi:hypothetical protein